MKIAVDFDGVLIDRKGIIRKNDFINDPPMEDALDAVNCLLDRGHDLFILTARREDHWPDIRKWLKKHDFPFLRINNSKEDSTIYLDDRAFRFTNWKDFTKYVE